MEDEICEIKALEVASLFVERYYREVIVPHLHTYKNTVFLLLKEEESPESLKELEKLLKKELPAEEAIIFH